MRTFKLITNETCNHRCRFCHVRRERERPEVAGPQVLRQQLDHAAEQACQQLVVTGGEPTLRRDLVAIVAYAKKRGIGGIELETNATRITSELAANLKRAGLTRVRVHMPGWGPLADSVTGEVGGHTRTVAAIRALAAAGLEVDLTVPITRQTVGTQHNDAHKNTCTVVDIPAQIAAHSLPVSRVIAVVPRQSPHPDTCLPLPAACAVVKGLARDCRQHGLTLVLANEPPIPPCAFEHPGRVAHLFSLTPGGRDRPGHQHQATCEDCRVFDRCPGPSTDLTAAGFAARPIAADRIRRRLSIIASVEQQIERELVTPELYTRHDGVLVRGTTIRVNFHCNQACHFCFVSTHLPPASEARVRREIIAAAQDSGHVILSGGEPTLNPRLREYIALARSHGAASIEIQSNAILLADEHRTRELVDAGLQRAFVSLHGATAQTSDAVTAAPGTHVKTLAGIDVLAKFSVTTQLNFVFCRRNHHEFPAYVDMVATRWPEASICVSFVGASTDMVPHSTELIPRYREILPDLQAGLKIARTRGVEVAGFDSMCGIPLCLVPGDVMSQFHLAAIPEGFDGGEFIRAPACRSCSRASECFGVRRRYADLYGVDELRPL